MPEVILLAVATTTITVVDHVLTLLRHLQYTDIGSTAEALYYTGAGLWLVLSGKWWSHKQEQKDIKKAQRIAQIVQAEMEKAKLDPNELAQLKEEIKSIENAIINNKA